MNAFPANELKRRGIEDEYEKLTTNTPVHSRTVMDLKEKVAVN